MNAEPQFLAIAIHNRLTKVVDYYLCLIAEYLKYHQIKSTVTKGSKRAVLPRFLEKGVLFSVMRFYNKLINRVKSDFFGVVKYLSGEKGSVMSIIIINLKGIHNGYELVLVNARELTKNDKLECSNYLI